MQLHLIRIINLRKLYFLSSIGLTISIFTLILLISFTVYFFPKFDYINLFKVIYSIVISNILFKISTNKSSKLIEIKINKTKLEIEKKTYLLETIKKIKINNFLFTYYPKLTICFLDNNKITFRVDKNEKDYWKLIENLKEISINGRKLM
ncbi:MAG: hypothetical protein MUF43_05710 [Flavobacterium sp.]|nr:hypothetical protein [Flavobacterium sp.]